MTLCMCQAVLSVTCLTEDTCLAADPGDASLILARSHTFEEIDHEKILWPFTSLPQIQEGLRKYMHNVLVNSIVKLAQEKVWLGGPTFSI